MIIHYSIFDRSFPQLPINPSHNQSHNIREASLRGIVISGAIIVTRIKVIESWMSEPAEFSPSISSVSQDESNRMT